MGRTFDENIQEGPFFNGQIPNRLVPKKKEWKTIFDYSVMSPIGLSACPFVANERGMKLASELGYDLITWKTIRSKQSSSHPHPNFSFLQFEKITSLYQSLRATHAIAQDTEAIACANSIGNASYDLGDTLRAMIQGRESMRLGQLFISSIYSAEKSNSALSKDLVYLAQSVQDSGAHIVEINLSCPNVFSALYHNSKQVFEIAAAVVRAVSVPVIIKVGLFSSPKAMSIVLCAAARAGVRGIAGINTVAMSILSKDGSPFFGEARKIAGVSGAPIRPWAISWLKQAKSIVLKERLDLTIFAGGGITMPNHIDSFFKAGADAAMMATGAICNPLLAHQYQLYSDHKKSEK